MQSGTWKAIGTSSQHREAAEGRQPLRCAQGLMGEQQAGGRCRREDRAQLQSVETGHWQAYRPIHRAQHARRIEEDALEVLLRMDCDDPVPCGLRLGGDDGELLLQDGIQERALARVGLSDNSHIACTTRQVLLGSHSWDSLVGSEGAEV